MSLIDLTKMDFLAAFSNLKSRLIKIQKLASNLLRFLIKMN